MANSTNITYGGADNYDFAAKGGPIPFITLNKQYAKSPDGSALCTSYQATLNGTLTPIVTGEGSITKLIEMKDALESGFLNDGQEFKVVCDATTLILSYPTVNSINFQATNTNWVQTIDYAIQLEWPGETITGSSIHVESVEESWNVEIMDGQNEYEFSDSTDIHVTALQVSHALQAKGKLVYDGGGEVKPAWEQAREWVKEQLVTTPPTAAYTPPTGVYQSPCVLNFSSVGISPFNHMRTERRDERGGSFGITESWILFNNASLYGNAFEDFTASVSVDAQTGLTTSSLQGTIQGLDTKSYGVNPGDFNIIQTKYVAASGYWDSVSSQLLSRAAVAITGIASRTIHPTPINYTVGHNPKAGIITYSYTYNDRPCNFISNASSELITITDSSPSDVFASLTVLGRANGPILQNINTVTANKRSVGIDVVVQPTGECTASAAGIINMFAVRPVAEVDSLLTLLVQDISGASTAIYKSSDQDSWNPKTGRYTRTVEWTYTNC